ncbi:uncharacterized protein ATNIH1004_008234 [Aspergillus tanneri]|uniref:DUF6590 domain-containing protein n=1 Tax=Aspergillus tanneri TaxID=1220188 RepID=A0A5M9MMT2_9EURO|nr:uncharacterized protein ATNIH1004_008234 [Aspergillus tanneri]KAA8644037.1 hypothetical protein ATNIH1004_008234 [Aspergillus tanneri]
MSSPYNFNGQQASRHRPGAQYVHPRRESNDETLVAPLAPDPLSVVPRSHPSMQSRPYEYAGDPSRGGYPYTSPSPYSSLPAVPASAQQPYSSQPRPSTINPGNYTWAPGQHAGPGQSGIPNENHASRTAPRTGLGSGQGYSSPSIPQTPGFEHIWRGSGNLTTGPPTTHSPTIPGPQRVISAASSNSIIPLDPRYVVQKNPKSFFTVGRVFSILWHENEGSTGRGTQSHISEGPVFFGRFNERIHSGIRRMVVVKALDQCAWCFPVSTYSRKGVAKPGVDPSKHAVIYMEGTYPKVDPAERGITKEPIEVTPASPDQKLDYMSRLNFGKIYTVEHNVKVLHVGKITDRTLPRFLNYATNELRF